MNINPDFKTVPKTHLQMAELAISCIEQNIIAKAIDQLDEIDFIGFESISEFIKDIALKADAYESLGESCANSTMSHWPRKPAPKTSKKWSKGLCLTRGSSRPKRLRLSKTIRMKLGWKSTATEAASCDACGNIWDTRWSRWTASCMGH